MEGFKKNNVSHGFSRIELFVICLVVILAVFIIFPKAKNVLSSVKLNGAIESTMSYKESIDNYYVSQLMFDSSFSFNGVYTIENGDLVNDDNMYNISILGNAPSGGYLDFEYNILKRGCVVVDGFSVVVENGNIVSVSKDSCEFENNETNVAFGL